VILKPLSGIPFGCVEDDDLRRGSPTICPRAEATMRSHAFTTSSRIHRAPIRKQNKTMRLVTSRLEKE
jgi:hypothetical protein